VPAAAATDSSAASGADEDWTGPNEAPAISISIEPAATTPVVDAESPVIFPGYLLPDDDSEEPAHAGS
jgi:hypothetical protein